MGIMNTVHRVIRDPQKVPMNVLYRMPFLAERLSDEAYCKFTYRTLMGKRLDLDHPKSFNEKMQWLKLYDHDPRYTFLVDKYAVKEWVSQTIGEEHVVKTYAKWDACSDIDVSELPQKFVLKVNHDSGGVVICKDKDKFDLSQAQKKLSRHLSRNYYWVNREWPYKDVVPCVFAEEYVKGFADDASAGVSTDYKFYCINGEPRYLYVSRGMDNHVQARMRFLTLDWQFAPFSRSDYLPFEQLPPKPPHFSEMIDAARKLSEGTPFVRVDFYDTLDGFKFSEMTFCPCGGCMPFDPVEYDDVLGEMLQLPQDLVAHQERVR